MWGCVNLVLRSKSKFHIDMEVLVTGGDNWWFTGVYARQELNSNIKLGTCW
jgi:hypothetical protein